MTGQFKMSTAGKVVVVVIGLGALIAAGRDVYLHRFAGTDDADFAAPNVAPVVETAAAPAVVPEPDPSPEPEPEAQTDTDTPDASPPALGAPGFDVVRIEPDGSGLVAGAGDPGSRVTVFVDDAILAESDVDGSGKFAMFVVLDPSDQPRLLTLRADKDQQEVWSEDQIILAPTPAPEVAEDVTAPDPAPSTEDVARSETGEEAVAAPAAETIAALATPDTMNAAPDGLDPSLVDNAPATPGAETPRPTPAGTPGEPSLAGDPGTRPGADDASAPRPDPAATPAITNAPAPPTATADDPAAIADAPTPQAPGGSVAVLRAGADGVELLQTGTAARPQALEQLALDTISYSEAGEVLLAGRAPEGSAVRVYLDNRPVADLPIGADGRWNGEVSDVRPGVYTLRLDQVADDGSVGGRIETPFKREAPSVLQAARADGASDTAPVTAVTVQKGDTLWAISRERYGTGYLYVRVFEANRTAIRNPDLIYPGQVFAIPN